MKSPFNITKAMLPFAAIIVSIFIFTAAVEAATFTVTNTDGSGPGSLRAAVESANTNAGPDSIDFAVSGTIMLGGSDLVILSPLTINGPGANQLTVSGGGTSRVFSVGEDVTASIHGLKVTGGNGNSNGPGLAPGGGIFIDAGGALTLTNSIVSGNSGSHGGGIYSSHATLVILNSTVSGNNSFSHGGGIGSDGGPLTIANSTVSDNSAGLSGGGIDHLHAALTITNSTISGNSAENEGGGIVNFGGSMTVTNSTVTGNRSRSLGDGDTTGGGISTIGDQATVLNTIVAGNFRGTGTIPDDISLVISPHVGTIGTAYNNLIGDAATSGGITSGVNGNKVGNDGFGTIDINTVLNTTLADNGGPTRTHALVSGSLAIDAGAANTLTTDQRGPGFARVLNGATDIGAYESEAIDTDGDGVPDGLDNCPATPNREKIAFTTNRDDNREIYVMNTDGTGQINLTNNPALDIEPSFSSDGSKIVFVSDREGGPTYEIWVMNADGSGQTRLTVNSENDFEPAFSPDGSKIAFTSFRDGNREIYAMNADGTGQINLTNDPGQDINPTFSPDGTKIAFSSSRDGDYEVYVMNADGSGVPTNLTDNTEEVDSDPAFSPDGSKIAFRTDRDGASEIYVMNANGTDQINLTNTPTPAIDLQPSFSPDGSKIAFASDRGNSIHYEVYVMNADGTGQSNVTNEFEFDGEPSWGRQADSNGDGIGDACDTMPTTTVMDAPAATDYSDVVALSSTTTSNGSPVATGSVEFFVDGVSVGSDAVNSNGVATLNTQILLAAGSYTVEAKYTASEANLLDSSDTDSLTVTKEDAMVTASANNVLAVKVNAPGGMAGPVTLCADITDAADGSLGDIALAVPVTFVMAPVAPGASLQQSDAALSGGTACVTFANVPVNVYDVTISVGGNYYTGMGSTVLAIFDPSLGFTTGGGRVVNPATGNTLHFGFSFKYDRKTFKGQMLVMEHTANGPVRLKSNSLTSLSIVGNQAIVLGKANIANGSGNLNFRLNVIDNGEPGSSDLFGLKTTTAGGSTIAAFTIDPARTLVGGNIQVPQGTKK